MATLDTRLRDVLGGKAAASLAEGLNLHTVGDLLHHYPRRYDERGRLTSFGDIVVGEHATVFAEVVSTRGRQIRPKLHKTDVTIRDDAGRRMTMAIFNRPWSTRDLRSGRRAFFSGKVEYFNKTVQLSNPQYQLVDDEAGEVTEEFAGALISVYPSGAKADTHLVRRCVRLALDSLDLAGDPLPEDLRQVRHLLPLAAALRAIHTPAGWPDVQRARARLKWDEAFLLQVVLAQRRALTRALPGVSRYGRRDGLLDRFESAMHFTLTAGQALVAALIRSELAEPHPMYRLLQGEVGSGKTLVALLAMLTVVDSGGQAALLAPTEVLAQQHARSIRELLGPLAQAGELGGAEQATRIALLTGSLGAAARRAALSEVASGTAGIVVGTHALLSEGVDFADLGLVVVDEQHRFGVEQRDALRAKGTAPHVLVMTATPIPRTVAMTVFGDLEVSTLTELPAGRTPIVTHVVPLFEHPSWVDRAWTRVRETVAEGRQAFIVCPRIGDSGEEPEGEEPRPSWAVVELYRQLVEGPLSGLTVEALHGRLPAEEKEAVMRRFGRGETDVLVSTTVIEVGVDVPNAGVMVVMDADRFGVSQLHQLRGRVGRGPHAGLCLLVTDAEAGTTARERLDAVAATNDGFELSRVDLEQRREGDVLGAAQSGRQSSLRLLQLLRDEDIIAAARLVAGELVERDPLLAGHPALRQAVLELVDDEQARFLEKA